MHRADATSDRPAARGRPSRALLIDGLGTLVALAPPAPTLRGELRRRFGLEVSPAEAEHALAAEIAYYRAHMGLGRDADGLAQLRNRCAEVLRDALPHSDRLANVALHLVTETLLSALRFEAYPDARGALLRARWGGARIVVVSNWDVSLSEVLERVGLAPLLDGVVTSAAIGAPKPAPEIFRHALALAGVAADHALHVGDSPADDVAGAVACGIDAVLLRRDSPAAPPTWDGAAPATPGAVRTITSLAELDWP
jgi:HAD superfamily hydrolase (TIGR01549 family)